MLQLHRADTKDLTAHLVDELAERDDDADWEIEDLTAGSNIILNLIPLNTTKKQ